MRNYDKFKLSTRLLKCADMITPGSSIADIGTDHAYLPIYLALESKIAFAVASDLREGPLKNAKRNVEKYNLEKIIKIRTSDGLKNISEKEADEIVIAGMGGNLISKILKECTWQNKKSKKFILQPMKYEKNLRTYLAADGYKIEEEYAVECEKKIYVVMKASYTGMPYTLSAAELYIGLLENSLDLAAKLYINKQINSLINQKKGAEAKNLKSEEIYYSKIIKNLRDILNSKP